VLRGRCACNAVAFEVANELVVAYNCHCSNCRALKPTAHMFVGSKASWHEILDDLPQHDESPWP
jgi:hypothetical protein